MSFAPAADLLRLKHMRQCDRVGNNRYSRSFRAERHSVVAINFGKRNDGISGFERRPAQSLVKDQPLYFAEPILRRVKAMRRKYGAHSRAFRRKKASRHKHRPRAVGMKPVRPF